MLLHTLRNWKLILPGSLNSLSKSSELLCKKCDYSETMMLERLHDDPAVPSPPAIATRVPDMGGKPSGPQTSPSTS